LPASVAPTQAGGQKIGGLRISPHSVLGQSTSVPPAAPHRVVHVVPLCALQQMCRVAAGRRIARMAQEAHWITSVMQQERNPMGQQANLLTIAIDGEPAIPVVVGLTGPHDVINLPF
jgi:hypothetical protein